MKTIREETVGNATLRLLQMTSGYAGMVIADSVASTPIRGESSEVVWAALLERARKGRPGYFGFDGARAVFLNVFPDGFSDERYRVHERDYKDRARLFLNEAVPVEAARNATAADCLEIMKAYTKTNMLSQFEQSRTREVLRSAEGPEFVRAAAAITDGDIAAGLHTMQRVFAPHGQPSWPAATYLPYFWRPDTQMFLKPQVTVDFARRVGHAFADVYSARFNAEVYRSLLDLAAQTAEEIEALTPADRIDIQSFIWVIGGYDEKDVASVKAERQG